MRKTDSERDNIKGEAKMKVDEEKEEKKRKKKRG
jgi:hypothetical protein